MKQSQSEPKQPNIDHSIQFRKFCYIFFMCFHTIISQAQDVDVSDNKSRTEQMTDDNW